MKRNAGFNYTCLLVCFLSIECLGQLPYYVPKNGLKGWWSFSANALDASGNGNHGTVNGPSLVSNRFFEPNSAYLFDGINDYIQCVKAGPIGNPSMTVSFWMNTTQNNASHILSYGENGVAGRDFRILNNGACNSGLAFDTYNNQKAVSITRDTNWHFYTITYDSTKGNNVSIANIYRDAILLTSVCNINSSSTVNISNLFPITFGRYHSTAQTGYFKGSLDDVGIWNRVLTLKEIKDLYNGECPISCSSAIELPSVAAEYSISGNNRCGTIGGTCGGNEKAVYYSYKIPTGGISEFYAKVEAPFSITVGSSCGIGYCGQEVEIDCNNANLKEGAILYITIHSSESDAGSYTLQIKPKVGTQRIEGAVFVDLDRNGTFNGSDIGLGKVPIVLIAGCTTGPIVEATETSDDGKYFFNLNQNLPAGKYQVKIGSSGPKGDPSPSNCCIELTTCNTSSVKKCELGYPPPNCDPSPYASDNNCESAPTLCNLEVLDTWPCTQTPSVFGPWLNKPHCDGVYKNTSFYKFVAGSGQYTINFTVFACAGAGVQYGLMEECNSGGPYVICNGNANLGTTFIPSTSLTPCKTYVFWISGYSGAVCSYYIEVQGNFQSCKLPAVQSMDITPKCNVYCASNKPQKIEVKSDGLEKINGVEYWWNITGPNLKIENLQTSQSSLDITFAQPGTYEICLKTYHPCPGFSQPFCKQFVFEYLSDPFIEFKVCEDDFPWNGAFDENNNPVLDQHGNQWKWNGGPITLSQVRGGRFDYPSPKTNQCGCAYTQYLRITEATAGCQTDTCRVTIYDTIVTEVFKYIAVTDTLIIDAVLSGIAAPENINTLRVYPNPAMSHIYIHYGDFGKMRNYKLSISNAAGVEVFRTTIDKQTDYLDLSDWQGKGTYFLTIEDDTGKIIAQKKIIIQ